jgi:hypothetical protein
VHHGEPEPGSEKIVGLQQIPGHATTTAEVWLWRGRVPEVCDEPRPWVVLRADDWPMSSHAARRLAEALLQAADRADASDDLGAPGGEHPPRGTVADR